MGAVLGELGQLGYGVAYRVLDAQHFGVPQRRRRVVFVGRLGDWAAPTQVLLEPESGSGDPAARRPARSGTSGRSAPNTGRGRRVDIVNALTASMAGAGAGVDDNTAQGCHLVPVTAPTVTAKWAKGTGGPAGDEAQNLIGFDLAQITSGQNRSVPAAGRPHPPVLAGGAPHIPSPTPSQERATTPARTARDAGVPLVPLAFDWQSVEGAHALTERTSTVRPTVADAVRIGAAVRRLTPVECERLQGYPDGWTATSNGRPQSDAARYRQIGNSIAVPVFAWVTGRLAAYESTTDRED